MSESSENSARRAWLERLAARLEARRAGHLYRTLDPVTATRDQGTVLERIEGDGRRHSYIQFCMNNYLGLATHPEVIAAARETTAKFGTGSGASRLVAGSLEPHHQLETALARFKGAEAALVFPSGYMANLAVLTTFAGAEHLIVSDKWNHASLLDAARFSGALHRTYPHAGLMRAETLLRRFLTPGEGRRAAAEKLLVTDSVFSMDGDVADLPAACDAAERTGALLVIDEAHATGVLGERGAGLAELQGVEGRVALTVGTLSKALGSVGGFVAGPHAAIEMLINEGRPFIYTTALPPACSAAALAALRIVEREPARRKRVMALADHVRAALRAMGYDCGQSTTPIIPVILGDAEQALAAAEFLKARGLLVPAIRPPTVPHGTARLRVSVMATHSEAQVEQLMAGMRALRGSRIMPADQSLSSRNE